MIGDENEDGLGGPSIPADPELEKALREAADAIPDRPAPREAQPPGDEGGGEAPTAAAAPSDAAADEELERLRKELAVANDRLVRHQADFENFRKRAHSQAADDVDRATGRLAEAFLPVLDAAEAAYVNHPDEVGPLLNVMLTELKKHGLETLDLDGRPFDPEVAEAVAHQPQGGGEVVVAEVLRSGYRWRGKTLRAAMVRTSD